MQEEAGEHYNRQYGLRWNVEKEKVNFSLCFIWAPRHEGVLGEMEHSSTNSLASALDGGDWSATGHGWFKTRERDPVSNWIGGWVQVSKRGEAKSISI
jgi:hypothetical protein